MNSQPPTHRAAAFPRPPVAASGPRADPAAAVTALHHAHALGLIRLAYVMLGDRAAAEDVVQEAFFGLYRRWAQLSDPGKALSYLRSSVLNGCRSVLRKNAARNRPGAVRSWPGSPRAWPGAARDPHGATRDLDGAGRPAASAEAAALAGEERRAVMDALRRLPHRQREALVLRYYLDEPDSEIARAMGVSRSTVRSTIHRALAALGRLLGDLS